MIRIHNRRRCASLAAALSAVLFLAPGANMSAHAQEKLVAPEKNPPGDIPDNQVFITYEAPAGFSVKVPEGWSRSERADGVRFFDKYDIIDLTVAYAETRPTAATVKANEVGALAIDGHAVTVSAVKDVKVKSGPVVRIDYLSNSEPNAVTGKPLRLEHQRFVFFKEGKTVALDLAAPAGADNADQWQLISNSFRWK